MFCKLNVVNDPKVKVIISSNIIYSVTTNWSAFVGRVMENSVIISEALEMNNGF